MGIVRKCHHRSQTENETSPANTTTGARRDCHNRRVNHQQEPRRLCRGGQIGYNQNNVCKTSENIPTAVVVKSAEQVESTPVAQEYENYDSQAHELQNLQAETNHTTQMV